MVTDIQKSSGDFLPIEDEKTKKKKSKEPKTNLFSTMFGHNKQKSKIPALNLPSIERDLSPDNQLHQLHHDCPYYIGPSDDYRYDSSHWRLSAPR